MEWIKQLSNGNIVFLYLENLETLTQFEKALKNNGIKTEVELPIFGKQVHFHPLPDKVLETMRDCNLVKQLREINHVLEPIAQLIEGTDPDLYKQIQDSININFDI